MWVDTSPDSISSNNSDLLAHYLHHPLVASPGHIVTPESIGTRSKAIPRRTISILGTHEGYGIELPSSPLPSGSASVNPSSSAIHLSEISSEPMSAQEVALSASELVKLCPSSPSNPPPPPPTPQALAIRRDSLSEDALSPAPTLDSSNSIEFLSSASDSYSACHPQCAHRRLVRLQDGLYFRPLSVLVETQSVDSSFSEDDPSDSSIFLDSPTERSRSFDSSSRRLNKIRQITGDDIAQAVHDARLVQASCPWYLRPISGEEEIRYDYNGMVAAGTLSALVETLISEPLRKSSNAHEFISMISIYTYNRPFSRCQITAYILLHISYHDNFC